MATLPKWIVALLMVFSFQSVSGVIASQEQQGAGVLFFPGDLVCIAIPLHDEYTWYYSLALMGNAVGTLLQRYYETGEAYMTESEFRDVDAAGLTDVTLSLSSWAYRLKELSPDEQAELGEDIWAVFPEADYAPGLWLEEQEAGPAVSAELSLCVRRPPDTVAEQPSTPAIPAPPPVIPRPPDDGVPLAGTPLEVDRWIITGGDRDGGILLRSQLGSQYFGERADPGFVFGLVPVYVKNDTRRTETLAFASWLLRDDAGFEYTTQTMADMYLGDDRLDVTNIPPGATRFGYLVFQIREDARWLTLEFGRGRDLRQWRFAGL